MCRMDRERKASVKICVVIPTTGRALVTRQTVDRLAHQTRAPDHIVVVAVVPSDVAGLDLSDMKPQIVLASRGLCIQRNKALTMLEGDADIVVFFDDDFVAAADYLECAEKLFAAHDDVVGACGLVIADGVRGPGIAFDDAVQIVERQSPKLASDVINPAEALYGCNMVLRNKAIGALRFDENLPLYGWQEDIDFTARLGRRGRLVRYSAMTGVHMGAKGGRSPGRRLGYSQIANPVYLLRKGSIPVKLAFRLMLNNAVANLIYSIRPEACIDRRGRLVGNLLAIRDCLFGRVDPRRILDMR